MKTRSNKMGIIRPVTLGRDLHGMAESAAAMLGVQIPDLLRAGLVRVLVEFETTGTLAAVIDQPSPLLEPKTARRMAEMDDVLELTPGQGVAETVLGNLLADIAEGEFSILDGWNFDDPAEFEGRLKELAGKWNAEDAAEASLTSEMTALPV